MGQAVFEAEIFAVTGSVLPDEVDFANALAEEPRGFGDDGFEAAAAESSAVLGDGAKGAGMVAAFGDFHVGEMLGRGKNSRRFVVIQIRDERGGGGADPFAGGDYAIEFISADERVDFGSCS